MVEAEKDTGPKLLPFWVLAVVVGIAFAIMTTYLILWLVNKQTFGDIKYFYFFFIPAMLFILADTGLFYLRSRQLMNYLQSEDQVVKKAEEKMKEIKAKYGA